MSYSVIGILLLLFKFVSSLGCPGCTTRVYDNLIESFNDTAVTDFVLNEAGQVIKLLDCLLMCANDIRCRSYRHNVLTETCSTYGAGYSLPEKTRNNVTVEAGSRLYAMCGMSKSFASSCSTDADCDFANSTCLSGSCSCSVGYSYDVWTGDCVVRCSTYGDWFTLYKDRTVGGCNTKKAYVTTQQECMEACRDEVAFTCINVEFKAATPKCNLCNETVSDFTIYINPDWILYYRECWH